LNPEQGGVQAKDGRGRPSKNKSALFLFLLSSSVAAFEDLRPARITDPVPGRFTVCYDHSCASVATLSITDAEWSLASEPLVEQASNAADERRAIAASIAQFEQIVGTQLGTTADRGGNLAGFGRPGQLDCIDESTNSTTYLHMLAQAGLLKHHTLQEPVTRFGLFVGMPHTTAVIRENDSGVRYAVDAWFFDNGQPPYITELDTWKSGIDPY
jgi:hypothetical protein